MTMRIPLSTLTLSEDAKQCAIESINSGWISGTGRYIGEFEHVVGVKAWRHYALACSNGTVALRIALLALSIQPGDEVIVPALTFVAPAAMVKMIGAVPVLVDIDPHYWTLDPEAVEAAITPKTKAIIAVDLLGHPADYDRLLWIAQKHSIWLIEDAAEAHGAMYKGFPTGSFGEIATFSYHANKTIGVGEAGSILTSNLELYKQMKLFINHGMTSERPYWHEDIGDNCRLTNVQAAIGFGQVLHWQEFIEARQKVAQLYDHSLKDSGLTRRPVATWATEACWLYTVAHPKREFILNHLRSRGIDARAIWTALPDLPPYKSNAPFPVARKVAAETFWLPTWGNMPEATIKEVADAVLEAVAEAKLEAVLV